MLSVDPYHALATAEPAPSDRLGSDFEPIVTWAETAECTCPDACERDHELD